jgi:hypothetical protein
MKKQLYVFVVIYFFSLLLSIIGFFVDTDVNTNTIFMNVFEIIALSIFIFGIIAGTVYALCGIYYLLVKKVLKKKLID